MVITFFMIMRFYIYIFNKIHDIQYPELVLIIENFLNNRTEVFEILHGALDPFPLRARWVKKMKMRMRNEKREMKEKLQL